MKAMTFDGIELKEVDVKDSYNFMSEWVEGYIEHIPIGSLGSIDMWGNEEAKLIGLEPTIALIYENQVYDVVCGKVCFFRHDGRGNTIGLTEKDIKKIREKFRADGVAYSELGIIQALRY